MTIPLELTKLKQWILWTAEKGENGKVKKTPTNPYNGFPCDVTDVNCYATYEFVKSREQYATGIGFVLTKDDPYCFIDLDETSIPEEMHLQEQIYNRIQSYAEKSFSKKGLHIFCKGCVPKGKKKSSIEIYSSDRYFAVTGDTFRESPIHDFTEEILSLWNFLGGESNSNSLPASDKPEVADDNQVISWAIMAANGDKFSKLYQGHWQELGYTSQSEADFALIDIIAYYTENKGQVKRIFLSSELGKRAKALNHPSYLKDMISKSFDKKIDLKALTIESLSELSDSLEIGPPTKSFQEEKENRQVQKVTFPRGLLGEISEYVFEVSKRPLYEVSLISAIGVMAGFTGRTYQVHETGLNQYLLLIGSTGVGKSAIKVARDRIFKGLHPTLPGMDTYRGPDEIASPEALSKRLREHPCFMTYSGEIGDLIASMASANPGTLPARMKRTILNLYHLSGKNEMMGEMIYSDKANNQKAIMSPALTIIGETTPETFFGSINQKMISEGLIPRFLIIECPQLVPEFNYRASDNPPQKMMSKIGSIVSYCLANDMGGTHIDVRFTPRATSIFREFQAHCDQKINSNFEDASRNIWNRVNLKALKLAALCATGINYTSPEIEEQEALWAIDIVRRDVESLESRISSGEIAGHNPEQAQIDVLETAIRRWFNPRSASEKTGREAVMMRNSVITQSAISRGCMSQRVFSRDRMGATNAIGRAVRSLCDAGRLLELPRGEVVSAYGTSARAFRVLDPRLTSG